MSKPMSVEPAIATPRVPTEERAQRISQSLSASARRLRFSTLGHRGSPESFRARRRRLLTRVLRWSSFILLVALPSLSAAVYFGLIASDQYVAEARFSVRSGTMAGLDSMAALTGIPSIRIIQDTQVVTNYVRSRAMVEKLQAALDLKALYSDREADYFARLDPTLPIEKIVKYWDSMLRVSIQMPGGIVDLSVRAFRPQDAVRIANAVVGASETLVNEMNDRSRGDAVDLADKELHLAAERLADARKELEMARNQEGVLDAATSATKSSTLLAAVRTQQLQLQLQYDAMSSSASRDAPQMRELKLRIDAADRQLEQLQAEMTSRNPTPDAAPLSASMTRLSALNLQKTVAETRYTTAAVALERARVASISKQVYLTSFVRPVEAEEARYPRRFWNIAIVVLGGMVAWGCFCGLLTFSRGLKA